MAEVAAPEEAVKPKPRRTRARKAVTVAADAVEVAESTPAVEPTAAIDVSEPVEPVAVAPVPAAVEPANDQDAEETQVAANVLARTTVINLNDKATVPEAPPRKGWWRRLTE